MYFNSYVHVFMSSRKFIYLDNYVLVRKCYIILYIILYVLENQISIRIKNWL